MLFLYHVVGVAPSRRGVQGKQADRGGRQPLQAARDAHYRGLVVLSDHRGHWACAPGPHHEAHRGHHPVRPGRSSKDRNGGDHCGFLLQRLRRGRGALSALEDLCAACPGDFRGPFMSLWPFSCGRSRAAGFHWRRRDVVPFSAVARGEGLALGKGVVALQQFVVSFAPSPSSFSLVRSCMAASPSRQLGSRSFARWRDIPPFLPLCAPGFFRREVRVWSSPHALAMLPVFMLCSRTSAAGDKFLKVACLVHSPRDCRFGF
mmetsp:Transcript_45815/g.123559  ORF Transcript_45815/g.123559 Transcript_45815/m.123559 type:complete len:261 (+) Transcript_45815:877-1659(+)